MKNEVKLFENAELGKVRVVMKDGEPWFVAKDVCGILGIVNVADAVDSLELDERATVGSNDSCIDFNGLRTDSRIVSESGLYALVFKSRKPEAKRFRKWVTSEVLPAIRKTGGYGVPAGLPDFTDPVAAARAWADEYEGKMLAQATAKAALAERDHAIKTKAQIGSRREATSMATASVAVRRAAFLADKMGEGTTYKSVIAIPWLSKIFALSKGLYSQLGKILRRMSEDLGFDVREVPDSRYGTVKAYHVDVIDELYFRLTQDKNMLRRYRKAD